MAMNRTNYIEQGKAMAQAFVNAGKMQADGIPVNDLEGKPLNMSMNGSWQAVAWKEGFAKVQNKWAAQAQSCKEAYGTPAAILASGIRKAGYAQQSPRETARKHVAAILAQAYAADDTPRAKRILCKVAKLRAKWDL